ncbi:hypothetical protein L3Y34_007869 [Caenorhabditis briggsae]|uniref:G-protein coupled receptors family 1 profile domain-containing protein n=1 Tax=Caenorhabditis briggsae TaxID=6238 RepID=A0AAE9A3P5_CAEBR|nr:hypothetical protein L3Y34_007869 [Caenorhabditis briggsae]
MSIPNETYYNFHDPYNIIAGVAMGFVSMIGVLCNYLVVTIFFENSSEKTSFNILNVTRAFVNLFILIALFLIVFLPTALLGYTPLLPLIASTLIIFFSMAFYTINENQTLITAVNRLCALYFPFQYTKLFGIKPTMLILSILWAWRLGEVIVPLCFIDFSVNKCYAYFSPDKLSWMVTSYDYCADVYNNTLLVAVIIFGLSTVLNIATFSKVLYFYRNKNRTDVVSKQKERKNIFLFFQTIIQDLLYVIDFSFTFYFNTLIDHRLWTFLSGTLIWQLIHALDGSLSNIYILGTTFLGLFLPKTVLGFSPYPPALESTLIHISNTLYLGNEYQIILVAVNRFIAMFLPVYYNKLCGFKSTLLILVLIYLVRIVIVIFETYDQLKVNCYTSFLLVALAWRYDFQAQCQFEDNILLVISITFAIMTAINGATLLKIISFYKSSKNESNETRKRIRRNVFLFFQTGLQDSLYLIDLSFMMKFSYLSEARVWSYISGTFVWECLHSIDGFIMIMFNEKLSLLRKRLLPTPSATHLAQKTFTVSVVSRLPEIN